MYYKKCAGTHSLCAGASLPIGENHVTKFQAVPDITGGLQAAAFAAPLLTLHKSATVELS